MSFYTANRFNDSPQEAYEAFYADAFVHCPVRRWAEVASALLDVRTYVWTRHIDAVQDLKAFHGVELSFVFGTLFDELHTPAEEAMSAYVRDTWTSAAMGAPTVKEMEWPLYDPPTAKWMILDLVPEVETHLRLEICEFLLAEGWPPY